MSSILFDISIPLLFLRCRSKERKEKESERKTELHIPKVLPSGVSSTRSGGSVIRVEDNRR